MGSWRSPCAPPPRAWPARGFAKGDVFAHYAPNLPEYAVAFHAVAMAGGVNTTANPLLTAGELADQLRDCGARLLVTVPPLLEKAAAAAERAGVEEIFVYGEAAGATPFASLLQPGGRPPQVVIDPASDVVALPYSSGTTGLPKGVMLTHRNLVANICQVTSQGFREDERVIACLPFFHIYGLVSLMNLPLYGGATVVTMPRFDLAEFLRVVQDYRITRALVVPPIVLALAKHPLVDEFDLSSLEFMNSGAAPLSAELEVACGKRLGCRMQQGYGLTETSPTTHWVNDDLAGQMPGLIGPPVPNTECRIIDVATGEDAPAGEPGELCIRGVRGRLGVFLRGVPRRRAGQHEPGRGQGGCGQSAADPRVAGVRPGAGVRHRPDLLQRHRERQVHEHVPGKARGEHQRPQLAPPALTRRDQPQIPEIDLELTARRPVIDPRGHLAARPAPLSREPVQRPLRHHYALPGQQDPDLHHRHLALDPRGDLLMAGLQLRPPLAVPVRPHRPDHRHDLPDQLIGELLLTSRAGQAGRHRGRHVTLACLAVNAGLRGHRPLALPREPGPQHLSDLDH